MKVNPTHFSIQFALLVFLLGLLASCNSSLQRSTPEIAEPSDFVCDGCPELAGESDTLKFITEVRQYLAKNADSGLIENELCSTYAKFSIQEFPVQRYLEIFQKDLGAASCGQVAKMMVKILVENGVDAYTYCFGFEDKQLAHEVVLFKLNNSIFITDPYLNYTLLDVNGEPLDIFSLISMIKRNNLDIRVTNDKVLAELIVDERLLDNRQRELGTNCEGLLSTKTTVRDSIFKLKFERCFPCDTNSCFSFISRFETELTHRTGFDEFHEGYALKTRDIWGAQDHPEIDRLITEALNDLTEQTETDRL